MLRFYVVRVQHWVLLAGCTAVLAGACGLNTVGLGGGGGGGPEGGGAGDSGGGSDSPAPMDAPPSVDAPRADGGVDSATALDAEDAPREATPDADDAPSEDADADTDASDSGSDSESPDGGPIEYSCPAGFGTSNVGDCGGDCPGYTVGCVYCTDGGYLGVCVQQGALHCYEHAPPGSSSCPCTKASKCLLSDEICYETFGCGTCGQADSDGDKCQNGKSCDQASSSCK